MILVSALIQHHAGPTGDVLILKNAQGKWEFPCTRLHTAEEEPDAVARLAAEQLGITVTPGKLTMIGHKMPSDGTSEHIACGNITHNTNTKCDYHCYYEAIDTYSHEPKVDGEYAWVHPSELGQYEFAGDDANFMAKYDPWINGRFIPDVRMN